jgi:hypothetical protein
MKKRITMIAVAMLGFGFLHAQTVTHSDNFAENHDYTADGFEGTIWEGMNVNTGVTDDALNNTVLDQFQVVDGELVIESANSALSGIDVSGPYIYRTVAGGIDFEVELKVTGGHFMSFMDSAYFNNSVGIFVRDVDHSTDNHIFSHFFELWGFHTILKSSVTGVQTEVEVANGSLDIFPSLSAYPYMKMTRAGNLFTVALSPDAFTWTDVNSVERTDLEGVDLEVGIGQASYSDVSLSAVVDDFKLTHAQPASISDKNFKTGAFKAFGSYNTITIESSSSKLISSASLYSIDGRVVASDNMIEDSRYEFNDLQPGLYITVATVDGVQSAKKVIVN